MSHTKHIFKCILFNLILYLVPLFFIGQRTYGFHKKSKLLPKIKPDPIKKKDPIFVPDHKGKVDPIILPGDKIPSCSVGCSFKAIPIDCRQETFAFENGVRCKSCDIDICTDAVGGGRGGSRGGFGDIGGNTDLFGREGNFGGIRDIGGNPGLIGRGDNIRGDRWQNTGGMTEAERWMNGDVWQNQRPLGGLNNPVRNRGRGRDNFFDGPQLTSELGRRENRGGFIGGLDGPIQGGFAGRQSRLDRLREGLNRNNRFSRNEW